MDNLMLLLFLFSIPLFLLSLFIPERLLPLFKGKFNKKGMRWFFGLLIPVSFVLFGITTDSKNVQNNPTVVPAQETVQATSKQQVETQENIDQVAQEPVPIIEVKKETTAEDIPFKTTTKNDSALEKGQTKVTQQGVNGTKEIVFEVTYTDGKETGRKQISESVKIAPVDKIVANGTKETQPVYVAPVSCGDDYYRNVDGNCVHRPSATTSSGATAQCRDGSYSFSQHRSGTCSGHGGVAVWF